MAESVILKWDISEPGDKILAQQILRPEQLSLVKPPAIFKPTDFVSGTAKPSFITEWGALYGADCLKILPKIKSEPVDTVFANPPFNLQKLYGWIGSSSQNEQALTWVRRLAVLAPNKFLCGSSKSNLTVF